VDYSRPLYGIFVDVTELQKDEDCGLLVAFAQFLQRLLQGEAGKEVPRDQVASDALVGALGYETGTVTEVGPVYSEVDIASTFQSLSMEETFFQKADDNWKRDLEVLTRPETKEFVAKNIHYTSSKSSHGVRGGRTYKEYKRFRFSRDESRNGPGESKPWGQLEEPTSPPDLDIDLNQEEDHRFFVDSRGYLGVATGGIRTSDTICQFQACDVVAILRWQERSCCYSIVGRATFPKRRNEVDTPLLKDLKENFQFSVPTSEECVQPMSLWLTLQDLQMLTE